MEYKRWLLGCSIVFVLGALLALSGCKPDYPKCETDEHCRSSEQGQKEGKLYCVNGLCQECRTDEHCGDPGMECNAGVCEEIPGYCTSDADCPGNGKCRDNRCGPECKSDDECGPNEKCEGGECVAKAECSVDADCEADEICQDGKCVPAPDPTCSLETVYFAFDSSSLSSTARSTLQDNADCIKEEGSSVELAGHADQRGTNEYNIALGERRARSVKDYLENLGVSSGSLDTISYGEERPVRQCPETGGSESCYEENRRVEFNKR